MVMKGGNCLTHGEWPVERFVGGMGVHVHFQKGVVGKLETADGARKPVTAHVSPQRDGLVEVTSAGAADERPFAARGAFFRAPIGRTSISTDGDRSRVLAAGVVTVGVCSNRSFRFDAVHFLLAEILSGAIGG